MFIKLLPILWIIQPVKTSGLKAGRITVSFRAFLADSSPTMSSNDVWFALRVNQLK